MSSEEDTELKELIVNNLENKGIISKIKAELRANVFLALEDQGELQNISGQSAQLKEYLSTKEGLLVTSLVKEFLECFNLDYTLAVLEPEMSLSGVPLLKREDICKQLGLDEQNNKPLIESAIKKSSEKPASKVHNQIDSNKVLETKKSALEPLNNHLNLQPLNSKDSANMDTLFDDFIESDEKKSIFSISADKTMFPSKKRTEFGPNFNKTASSLSSLKDLPAITETRNQTTNKDQDHDNDSDATFVKSYNNTKYEPFKKTSVEKNSSSEEIKSDEEIEEDINVNDLLDSSSDCENTLDNTLNSSLKSHCDYLEPAVENVK